MKPRNAQNKFTASQHMPYRDLEIVCFQKAVADKVSANFVQVSIFRPQDIAYFFEISQFLRTFYSPYRTQL